MYKQPTHCQTPPELLADLSSPLVKYNQFSGSVLVVGSHYIAQKQPRPNKHRKKVHPNRNNSKWQLRVYEVENNKMMRYKLPSIVQQQSIFGYEPISQNMFAFWLCKSKTKHSTYMQEQQEQQQQQPQEQQSLIILQQPKPINTSILVAASNSMLPQLVLRSITQLQPTSLSTSSQTSASLPRYHGIHHQLSYIAQLKSLCLYWRYSSKQGGMLANNLAPAQANSTPKCLMRVQYIHIRSRQQQIVGDICTYYTGLRNVYEYVCVLHPKYIDHYSYYQNKDKTNTDTGNAGQNTIGNIQDNNNSNTNTNLMRNKPLLVLYDSMFPLPNHMLMVEQDRTIKLTVFAMNPYRLVWPNHAYGHRLLVQGYQLGVQANPANNNNNGGNDDSDSDRDGDRDGDKHIKQQMQQHKQQQQVQIQQQQGQGQANIQQQNQNITQVINYLHQQPDPHAATALSPQTVQQQPSPLLQTSAQLQCHKSMVCKSTQNTTLVAHTTHNRQYRILRIKVNLNTCQAVVLSESKFSRSNKLDVVVGVTHTAHYCGVLVCQNMYMCYHGIQHISTKNNHRDRDRDGDTNRQKQKEEKEKKQSKDKKEEKKDKKEEKKDKKEEKKEKMKQKNAQNMMKQQSQQMQQKQQQYKSQSSQSQWSQYGILSFKHNYGNKPQKFDIEQSCSKDGRRILQSAYVLYIYACARTPPPTIKSIINKQNNDGSSQKYILVNQIQVRDYHPYNNMVRMVCDQKYRYRIICIKQTYAQAQEQGKAQKQDKQDKQERGMNNGRYVNFIELSNKKLIYMKMLQLLFNKNKNAKQQLQNTYENQEHIVEIVGKQMLELL